MNYNKLKYFHIVASCGNMTNAAKQCFISQSAISKHMAELESELGVQLFIRNNRSVELTEAGRVLNQETAAFFNAENTILRKVQLAGGKQERLSIGVMASRAVEHISTLVEQFRQAYPSIGLDTWRLNWEPARQALLSGKIDAAFLVTVPGELDFDRLFDCVVLKEAPGALIVSRMHPLAKERSIRLTQAGGEHFLFPSKEENAFTYENLLRSCRKAGFEPNIVATYDFTETLLSMVRLNTGVLLLSLLAPVYKHDCIVSIPIEDEPPSKLVFAWRKGNGNPSIQQLAKQAMEVKW